MPRIPRAEIFVPNEVCIVHLIQRCVRKSFLTGLDPVSGKDYSHRRELIRARMERLASVLGIDILSYAILSNHLHIVARNRPDVVATWSNQDVAIRWLRIFPGCHSDEFLGDPTQHQVDTLARDKKRIEIIRTRLSDFSWFMKALCEPIARISNRQDEVTGHFWEGRFKAQAITDEASLLACSMYVDLNPIRAFLADSPENSVNTSVYDRLKAEEGETIPSSAAELVAMGMDEAKRIILKSTPDQIRKRQADAKKRKGPPVLRDAWLAPLTLTKQDVGPRASKTGLRASDKGFLDMSVQEYAKLLVWVQLNKKNYGKKVAPEEFTPALTKIKIDGQVLCDMVERFKEYFGKSSATGSPQSLEENAEKRHRRFVRGQRAVRECFSLIG